MAQRRTRKQKETARYQFSDSATVSLSWDENDSSGTSSKSVKGEKRARASHKSASKLHAKNSISLVNKEHLASVKKEIFKTLVITSLILSVEVMLYWFHF